MIPTYSEEILSQEANPSEHIQADVIIIGAGVVGGLMAWRLSQQGLNVAILEAGAEVDRVKAIERYKNDLQKEANSPYEMMPWAPVPDDTNPLSYYLQPDLPADSAVNQDPTKQIAFDGYFMRLVGGTSWHWTGHAERLFPNDFRMKEVYGVGKNWPIRYEDIEPYYQEVEDAWGVAGGPDCIAPSPDIKYPMPEVPRSYSDKVVGQKVSGSTLTINPDSQPIPHCPNSVPRDGRPQCCGNSSCLPICPIGAKYDAGVHVEKAKKLGTRVLPNRVAYQVAVDEKGEISGIYYRNFDADPEKGPVGLATGTTYILAAHAVETARLMLLSGGRYNVPDTGLANSSDQVGRNLMGFANINTMGYTPDETPLYPYRGPVSATGAFGQWRDGEFRKRHASIAPFILNSAFKAGTGPLEEARKGIEEGLWGPKLLEYVNKRTAHQFNLHSTIEILPDADNRVKLPFSLGKLAQDESLRKQLHEAEKSSHQSYEQKQTDSLGMPRPEVYFKLDDYTMRGCREAWDWHLQVFDVLGVKTITGHDMPDRSDESWNALVKGDFNNPAKPEQNFHLSLTSGDAVIAGTACMGDDPKSAVVNAHCQSFDHDNLYVVGTANYCSVGSASPSLTAAALGLRTADHIASQVFNIKSDKQVSTIEPVSIQGEQPA